jgi:hypothetical protein
LHLTPHVISDGTRSPPQKHEILNTAAFSEQILGTDIEVSSNEVVLIYMYITFILL